GGIVRHDHLRLSWTRGAARSAPLEWRSARTLEETETIAITVTRLSGRGASSSLSCVDPWGCPNSRSGQYNRGVGIGQSLGMSPTGRWDREVARAAGPW